MFHLLFSQTPSALPGQATDTKIGTRATRDSPTACRFWCLSRARPIDLRVRPYNISRLHPLHSVYRPTIAPRRSRFRRALRPWRLGPSCEGTQKGSAPASAYSGMMKARVKAVHRTLFVTQPDVATNLDQTSAIRHTSTLLPENHIRSFIPQIQSSKVINPAPNKNNERHQADLQPEGRPA